MFKSVEESLIADPRLRCWDRGACSAWRHSSRVVVLFAVYAFIVAGLQTVRAFSSAKVALMRGRPTALRQDDRAR